MSVPSVAGSPVWEWPKLGEILNWPLPDTGFGDRSLLRGLTMLARGRVHVIGLEHIAPANDPFILALNHTTRREALLVPAVLMLHRRGRLIHFLSDWNFRLIPGIGLIYRRAETITITRKSARPRVLNVLKPLYHNPKSVLEQTRARLLAGMSVGIFPEGRVNRDPDRLLKGRTGAAFLSLETGVPIIPAGIRFAAAEADRPTLNTPLEIRIGAPLTPPPPTRSPVAIADLGAWHAHLMTEIARLSGRAWASAGGEQRWKKRTASERRAA